jgi:putative chitinase
VWHLVPGRLALRQLRCASTGSDRTWCYFLFLSNETEFSFKPKEEKGKGANYGYGASKQIIDSMGCRGPKDAVYSNVYYGRGYVQITHDVNYKALGKAYGIGEELYINPDRALEPKIAYFIVSHGMRHGTFTTGIHKLSSHIYGKKCDYSKATGTSAP